MPLFMTGDDKDNKHLENDNYISIQHSLCCSHLFQL